MLKQSIVMKYQPKTLEIKGKNYVSVAERVKAFWKACEEQEVKGSIRTEIVELNEKGCIMKATIMIDHNLISEGYAREERDSSMINRTSFLENCETSAVGRALGFCGVGIETDIASYNEVEAAEQKQEVLQAREISSRYYCSKCGKPVTATKNRSIENIVEGTKKTYGKILCVDCAQIGRASCRERV